VARSKLVLDYHPPRSCTLIIVLQCTICRSVPVTGTRKSRRLKLNPYNLLIVIDSLPPDRPLTPEPALPWSRVPQLPVGRRRPLPRAQYTHPGLREAVSQSKAGRAEAKNPVSEPSRPLACRQNSGTLAGRVLRAGARSGGLLTARLFVALGESHDAIHRDDRIKGSPWRSQVNP
jgi:hypothetical protein